MSAAMEQPLSGHARALLKDRLGDFQRAARGKGTLEPQAAPEVTASPGVFMRGFFDDVTTVQRILKDGRSNVNRFGQVQEQILQSTTCADDQAASEQLHSLVEETNTHVSAAKEALDKMKTKSQQQAQSAPSSAERRIMENMMRATVEKYQLLLLDFQKGQVDCKRALETREFREMQLLCPEANAAEVHEMIQAGETSAQMVIRKMAGTHAMLFEEVQRIQEKHQDILRLERSVADLHQMFQEVAALVDSQGDMLDVIEENVHSANSYTTKANEELETAVKVQRSTKKWECCLLLVLLIIAAAILVPITLSLENDPGSSLSWILVSVFAVVIIGGLTCCYCRFRSLCGQGSCSCWRLRSFNKMSELPM